VSIERLRAARDELSTVATDRLRRERRHAHASSPSSSGSRGSSARDRSSPSS
jgi:hypothetical protein